MKKLTKGQRFALAREARRLAMECVEGTAPKLGRGVKFLNGQPWCVAGHLQMRAGLGTQAVLCSAAFGEAILLINANDLATTPAKRHAAVVFPLLALADALEASAASLPQAAPEVP